MTSKKKNYNDSDPPSGAAVASSSLSLSFIRKQLDEKASKETMLAIFEGVKGDIKDVKDIALTAVKKAEKPHTCLKADVLEMIQNDQQEIKDMLRIRGVVKVGTVVVLVTALVAAITFLVRLEYTVDGFHQSMNETKAVVDRNSQIVTRVARENGDGKKELVKALADELDKREELKEEEENRQKRMKSKRSH